MYYMIEHGEIKWPDKAKHGIDVQPEAKDIIIKLLNKDKLQRLGQKGGIDEVIKHPWFASLNLEDLKAKKI